MSGFFKFNEPTYTHDLLVIGNLDDADFITIHVHDGVPDIYPHESLQKLAWDYRLSIEGMERVGDCCLDERTDLSTLREAVQNVAADGNKGCEGRAMQVVETFMKRRGTLPDGVPVVPVYLAIGTSPRPRNLLPKPSHFGWD